MEHRLKVRNRRVLAASVAFVALMVGMSYAAVPLYDLFCRVTGYGGTTGVAAGPSQTMGEREMRIRFDATVNNVPWRFQAVEREMRVRIGENAVAYYQATNTASVPVSGTATFNVTPQKAGRYFDKIECFCFTEQRLEPGQTVDMPVAFYVAPEITDDPNLDDVKTITLSYTFFRMPDAEAKTARAPSGITDANDSSAERGL